MTFHAKLPAAVPDAGELVSLDQHTYGRVTRRTVVAIDGGYRYELDIEVIEKTDLRRIEWQVEE